MKLKAFIGHSFQPKDKDLVNKFLDLFDHISKIDDRFEWDHAEEAAPKELSIKVIEKMAGKNLFIGICTNHQKSISFSDFKKSSKILNRYFINSNEIKSKASDWLLQEIGFSVGKGMNIIILLEEGVEQPGGIQGNLEHIPFSRQNPETSYTKIMEMISSLAVPKSSNPTAETIDIENVVESGKDIQTVYIEEPTQLSEWDLEDFGYQLTSSIYSKDALKVKEITEKFYNSPLGGKKEDRIRWDAYLLGMKLRLWGEDNLSSLLALTKEYPDNYYLHMEIAHCYFHYQEYKQSIHYFEKSYTFAVNDNQKVSALTNTSYSHAQNKNKTEAINVIKRCFPMARHNPSLLPEILESLAELFEDLEEYQDYKIFTESVLQHTPSLTEKRFSLGLKYLNDDENSAALFHYEFLSKNNPNQGNWNNLGVAFSKLMMPAKAIHAYQEAEKKGDTTSLSNLAHQYIAGGFLDDAQKMIDKAVSIENYDGNIGKAIIKIKEMRDQEEEKQKKHIDAHAKKRTYYAIYAEKYLMEDITSLPTNWVGPKCPLELSISDHQLQLIGEYEEIKTPYPAWQPRQTSQNKEETKINIYIIYIGEITGATAKYKYWISKEKKPDINSDKPEGMGIMILDSKRISLLESKPENESFFFDIVSK